MAGGGAMCGAAGGEMVLFLSVPRARHKGVASTGSYTEDIHPSPPRGEWLLAQPGLEGLRVWSVFLAPLT